MSNTRHLAPYISEPPIYDKFLDEEGEITGSWSNWLNSITQSFSFSVVHDVIADNGPPVRREPVAVLNIPSFTESDRDLLQNSRNGTLIYNLDTNVFNFKQGGAWVTFTPVAA